MLNTIRFCPCNDERPVLGDHCPECGDAVGDIARTPQPKADTRQTERVQRKRDLRRLLARSAVRRRRQQAQGLVAEDALPAESSPAAVEPAAVARLRADEPIEAADSVATRHHQQPVDAAPEPALDRSEDVPPASLDSREFAVVGEPATQLALVADESLDGLVDEPFGDDELEDAHEPIESDAHSDTTEAELGEPAHATVESDAHGDRHELGESAPDAIDGIDGIDGIDDDVELPVAAAKASTSRAEVSLVLISGEVTSAASVSPKPVRPPVELSIIASDPQPNPKVINTSSGMPIIPHEMAFPDEPRDPLAEMPALPQSAPALPDPAVSLAPAANTFTEQWDIDDDVHDFEDFDSFDEPYAPGHGNGKVALFVVAAAAACVVAGLSYMYM